jgi:chemotaxis family two-component system sensor kinase Cph1
MEIVQGLSSDLSGNTSLVYQNCDREQIHLLGHIQSHGVLLAINESNLTIAQVSANTIQFFNLPASSLIDQPLNILFTQEQINTLLAFWSHKDLEAFNPTKLNVTIKRKKLVFQGVMHRTDGLLVLELEPSPKDIDSSLGFYYLAKAAAMNVRQAQDFDEMANLLVQEIRQITGFDRVLTYKFEPDHSGVVIAEAKAHNLEPLLGLHYPSFDIPEIPRKLYCKNWLRLIADLEDQSVPLIPFNNPLTEAPLDLSYSTLRSVSKFHIQYLRKMGVSASFSISLINADKLWGLVVCHHYAPKYVGYEIRKTCEFLGQIMSVEIVNK